MRKLSETPLDPGDRAAIEEAVGVLRDVLPVEEIVLFGSKARGDDDRESDIDILVLTERPVSRGERHAAVDAVYPIQLAHEVVISLVIVDSAAWRTGVLSVLPIRAEVESHGVAA